MSQALVCLVLPTSKLLITISWLYIFLSFVKNNKILFMDVSFMFYTKQG